jgi:hypothetical protein
VNQKASSVTTPAASNPLRLSEGHRREAHTHLDGPSKAEISRKWDAVVLRHVDRGPLVAPRAALSLHFAPGRSCCWLFLGCWAIKTMLAHPPKSHRQHGGAAYALLARPRSPTDPGDSQDEGVVWRVVEGSLVSLAHTIASTGPALQRTLSRH